MTNKQTIVSVIVFLSPLFGAKNDRHPQLSKKVTNIVQQMRWHRSRCQKKMHFLPETARSHLFGQHRTAVASLHHCISCIIAVASLHFLPETARSHLSGQHRTAVASADTLVTGMVASADANLVTLDPLI